MKLTTATSALALIGSLATVNAALKESQQHLGTKSGYRLQPSTVVVQSEATNKYPADIAEIGLHISASGTSKDDVKARHEEQVERIKALLTKASKQEYPSESAKSPLAVTSIVASKTRVNEDSWRYNGKCACDKEISDTEVESKEVSSWSTISATVNYVDLLPDLYTEAVNGSSQTKSMDSLTIELSRLRFQLSPLAQAAARKTLRSEAVDALIQEAEQTAEFFGHGSGISKLVEFEEVNPAGSDYKFYEWFDEDCLEKNKDGADWEAPGVSVSMGVKGKFALDA